MDWPVSARYIPSKTKKRPLPPESTTPAFFNTGSWSGVRSTALSAPSTMLASISRISVEFSADEAAAALISRETVRIVPSTGEGTAGGFTCLMQRGCQIVGRDLFFPFQRMAEAAVICPKMTQLPR